MCAGNSKEYTLYFLIHTHDIKDYRLNNICVHSVIPGLPLHHLILHIVWAYLNLLIFYFTYQAHL